MCLWGVFSVHALQQGCPHTPPGRPSPRTRQGTGSVLPLRSHPRIPGPRRRRTHRGRGTGCHAGPARAAPRELGHPGLGHPPRPPASGSQPPALPAGDRASAGPGEPASGGKTASWPYHSRPSGRGGPPRGGDLRARTEDPRCTSKHTRPVPENPRHRPRPVLAALQRQQPEAPGHTAARTAPLQSEAHALPPAWPPWSVRLRHPLPHQPRR